MNHVTYIAPNLDDERVRARRRYKMLIGGHSVTAESGKTISREGPGHRQAVVGEWPAADKSDVEKAIAAARQAFDDGPWPRENAATRSAAMVRLADLILENQEELALIECLEVGKPIRLARSEVAYCADLWRYAAGMVRGLDGDTHNNLGPNRLGLVLRDPIGVVGVITPWNFPMVIACERLPWSLGVGCTVVVKPSEFTSGTTIRMAELARDAGFPNGVFNVVTGYGNPAGQTLAEDSRVDMVAFTGSLRVGKLLGSLAASTIKRVGLELGGKGPQIVFADADLEAAANTVAKGFLHNSGQVCISGSRLIVERKIADQLLARVSDLARKTVVGDPLDETVQMGALVSEAHLAKVDAHVQVGRDEGAEVMVGGARLGAGDGYYFEPTILNGANSRMSIAREEIFGPVLSAMTFDDPAEAIRLANDTAYGLSAGVWTSNLENALNTIRAVRAGRCWINDAINGAPELPVGGYKQSGNGRDTGRYGFDEYSEFKTVVIALNEHQPWQF